MQSSRRARIRRNIGVAMMVSSMGLAGAGMTLFPAGAQDAATSDPVELEVVKTAYYVVNAGRAAPNTVTNEFPPGVVCLLRPELCPEEAAPVTGPLGEQIGQVEDAPEEPRGTAPPGSLPVAIFGGEARYMAAVQTSLPELAPGTEPGTFVLRLQETDPTYHSSSPAFRQAVLAAVASAGAGSPNQDEFMKVLEEEPVENAVIGVEACPVVTPFEAGDGQPEDAVPETDCLFGTNGVRLDDGTWEFDLTFAAQAWYDGTLPNEGVFFKSTAAPNLAYGDPDVTTHAQVTFQPTQVEGAVEEKPESSPPPAFNPPPPSNDNSSQSFSAPSSSNVFSPPPPIAATPEVAQPETAPEPATEPVASVPFVPEDVDAASAWWIWLLVPIFLAGMYLTAQSLAEEVVLAGDREGAMMRLIQSNGGVTTAPSVPGPREGAMTRLVNRS